MNIYVFVGSRNFMPASLVILADSITLAKEIDKWAKENGVDTSTLELDDVFCIDNGDKNLVVYGWNGDY